MTSYVGAVDASFMSGSQSRPADWNTSDEIIEDFRTVHRELGPDVENKCFVLNE